MSLCACHAPFVIPGNKLHSRRDRMFCELSILEPTAPVNSAQPYGCVSFFCAACLLGEGGRVEPGGGTLAKRKGVVQTVKERESKMQPEDLQQRWKEQGEEATAAVAQWRMAHSKATLAEIEQAVDEQINRLRAQLIEQAAQVSTAAGSEASQGLVCEQCGQALQARGRARRRWQTQGGQQVEVERTYVTCPHCGGGFFPPG